MGGGLGPGGDRILNLRTEAALVFEYCTASETGLLSSYWYKQLRGEIDMREKKTMIHTGTKEEVDEIEQDLI